MLELSKILVIFLVVIVILSMYQSPVFAHQSGCHRWHSCPSDTGSYTCGDTGYCSECPDNQYCKNQMPITPSTVTYTDPNQNTSTSSNQNTNQNNNPDKSIPSWIKNNAKWWSDGQIGDSDFTKGIQYLVQNNIIIVPSENVISATNSSGKIPTWIKNNAKWWSQGQIDDTEFLKGIQYLVQQNIIHTTVMIPSCNDSLWDHVYNPQRLQIIDKCKTVSGIIDAIIKENDGDLHIRLHLDSQYESLINDANINGQHGDMVLEPICQGTVSQEDAIDSCANFSYDIMIPKIGTHIMVTGSYVLDKEHGSWAEIHPVSSIQEIP